MTLLPPITALASYLTLGNLISILIGQQPVSEADIYLRFYDSTNTLVHSTSSYKGDYLTKTGCQAGKMVNFIIPAWNERCESQGWVQQQIRNFYNPAINSKGGCVCCFDYSKYSITSDYYELAGHFDAIAEVAYKCLVNFALQSLVLSLVYVVAFSFGGMIGLVASRLAGEEVTRLAGLEAGRKSVGFIDVIDPVNPALQFNLTKFPTNFKECAQHVQCIHCSIDFGSPEHNKCHEDWVMGNCGQKQACATDPPYGSHGQCPNIYVFGGPFDFLSVVAPASGACPAELLGDLNKNEYGVARMGFKMPPNTQSGEYYADTFKCQPYNDPAASTCISTIPVYPI